MAELVSTGEDVQSTGIIIYVEIQIKLEELSHYPFNKVVSNLNYNAGMKRPVSVQMLQLA